jgi:hypothetical protein
VNVMNDFSRPTSVRMADALPAELADKREAGRSINRSLGKWLQHRHGRWVGDLVCEEVGRNADNVTSYRVRKRGEGSDAE